MINTTNKFNNKVISYLKTYMHKKFLYNKQLEFNK